MRRVLTVGLAAALAVLGCSERRDEAPVRDPYVFEPVKIACAYIPLIEKPDATRVLLMGDEAKELSACFTHAGVRPMTTADGTFDLIVVSCDEMTDESCGRAAKLLSENGVMAWLMDVRDVTAGRFRNRVRSFALDGVHLWMPSADRWLLTGRKTARTVKLSAMLDVFAREGAFGDLEKMRCGTVPALFANYAGTRADVMPAFAGLELTATIRPANFLTRKVVPVDWISSEGMDEDIARSVLAEIRSMQVVRRQVVEGDLLAEAATDKKGEERATDVWARSCLRNPNDLLLLERIDRLERNASGFLAVGRVLQAMKCYETIVLIRPNDASAVRNFGLCLKKIGKLDLAEKVLSRAQELSARPSAP